jgi:hypothetical protein
VADHPHAPDSLDGVQQCGLGTGDVDAPRLAVQRALDALVQKGSAVKKMLPDGTVLYAGTRPHARAP